MTLYLHPFSSPAVAVAEENPHSNEGRTYDIIPADVFSHPAIGLKGKHVV